MGFFIMACAYILVNIDNIIVLANSFILKHDKVNCWIVHLVNYCREYFVE